MNINKDTRLEVVKMIVSSQELSTQEELLRELERSGFPSTQATLSRDLRQLHISKGLNEAGVPPGHAAHVAYDIDNAEIPEVLGTVAGDDTIFMVLAEDTNRQMFLNRLNAIDTLRIE